MPLSLKQSNLKILSTTCPKLLKNTGRKNQQKPHRSIAKKKQKDDEINKSKKIKNNNTTTSPAPAQLQEPVQEVPAFKQKLAMATNVISGHLNSQNAQNNQVPNNVKEYSPRNPPVVILTDRTSISMCKGCGKKNYQRTERIP